MKMKKLLCVLATVVLVFCTSCVVYGGIPQKLDNFVTVTEAECNNYSKEDWEKSRAEYGKLLDSYKNSKKAFTQEEKEMAVRAMGRYNALLIKNGIVKSSMGVKEVSALLPEFIKGMAEGLEANSEEINRALRTLIDTNKINGAIEQLGSALEKMFGNVATDK